jgi:hypothetical protein
MTADEIWTRIEAELGGDYSITNLHSVDLQRSLVRPPREIVLIDAGSGEPVAGWLVLEECPGGPGYIVIFSEEDQAFGLGQIADGHEPALDARHTKMPEIQITQAEAADEFVRSSRNSRTAAGN